VQCPAGSAVLRQGTSSTFSCVTSSCQAGSYAAAVRKYPPVGLDSPAVPQAGSGQKIVSGQAYGNGIYEVTWSSEWYWQPIHVFNGVTAEHESGGHWAPYMYDASGVYQGSASGVPGYRGDWINLKLPEAIHLAYAHIYARGGYVNRSPLNYSIHGSAIGGSWETLVVEQSTVYNLNNNNHLHISVAAPISGKKYNQFRFAVSRTYPNPVEGCLNFIEIEFYGTTNCVLCPSGTYSAAVGASSSSTCVSCPAGSFSAVMGATVCEQCPQGKFSASTGMTTCLNVSLCSSSCSNRLVFDFRPCLALYTLKAQAFFSVPSHVLWLVLSVWWLFGCLVPCFEALSTRVPPTTLQRCPAYPCILTCVLHMYAAWLWCCVYVSSVIV